MSHCRSFQDHFGLARDLIEERMGPLHAAVALVLFTMGPTPLRAIADAVSHARCGVDQTVASQADDGSVRDAVRLLMKHEVVAHNPEGSEYSLLIGNALYFAVAPLLVSTLAATYGDAAELAATVLYEYHDLPKDVLVATMLRSMPSLGSTASDIVEKLCDEGVLAPVRESTALPVVDPARKQECLERQALASFSLSLQKMLTLLRNDCILRFLRQRYADDSASRIARIFIQSDSNRPKQGALGFPGLVGWSSALNTPFLQKKCADMPNTTFLQLVKALEEGDDAPLIPQTGSAEGNYMFNYTTVALSMQNQFFEAVVLARHGLIGVRIMKLLLEHKAMEDKFLAEEALLTHHDVRVTLAAMQRDGFVRVQELPKTGYNDRVTAKIIYLWTLDRPLLLETVRRQTAKTLRNARQRLRSEVEEFRRAMPPAYFVDRQHAVLSEEEDARAAAFDEKHEALSRVIIGFQEKLCILEYFISDS